MTLEVEKPADILERLYPNGRLGGVRLEGACPASLGERVELQIRVKGGGERHLTAQTRLGWVRHKGNRHLRECFGLDFIPDDRGSRERLLSFAHGEVGGTQLRSEPRFSIEWPVVLSHGGTARRETLADISFGGAFVATTSLPEPGTEMDLALRPPGALLSFKVRARVVWIRRGRGAPGMGLEFVGDARARDKLQKAVERLAR